MIGAYFDEHRVAIICWALGASFILIRPLRVLVVKALAGGIRVALIMAGRAFVALAVDVGEGFRGLITRGIEYCAGCRAERALRLRLFAGFTPPELIPDGELAPELSNLRASRAFPLLAARIGWDGAKFQSYELTTFGRRLTVNADAHAYPDAEALAVTLSRAGCRVGVKKLHIHREQFDRSFLVYVDIHDRGATPTFKHQTKLADLMPEIEPHSPAGKRGAEQGFETVSRVSETVSADVDRYIEVVRELGTVDREQVAERLGVSAQAAGKALNGRVRKGLLVRNSDGYSLALEGAEHG